MAKLTRYQPQYDLWDLSRDIDRMIDEAFSWFPSRPFSRFWSESWLAPFTGDNLAVDMYETDREIVVQAALPGVKPDDIEIEEREGTLTIRAKYEEEEERQGYDWRLRERRAGSWQRTVQLPEAVRGDKAEAELRDGVLTITLPKREPGKTSINRIKVKAPKLKLPQFGRKDKSIKVTQG